MKILEVNKFFYLRRGAERHFLDLMTLLRNAGHEVGIFSMRHPENIRTPWEKYFVSQVGYNADDSTFSQRCIGIGRLFWSFEARQRMSESLHAFHPDIVHVHNAYHQLSLSFFLLIKKARIPLVMTVHDYAMISPDKDRYYPEIGRQYLKFLFVNKYGFMKRLLLVLEQYWNAYFGFYDVVDRFIVPSHFVEKTLLSAGIAPERIIVIPHFISDEEVSSVNISDTQLPDRYLFSFGAVSREKGTHVLLRLSQELNVPLVIAGRMEDMIDFTKYPLAMYVGIRTKAELQTLIRGSLCVVSASTLSETFGLTALESIALGRPYFALETGALSEIIENGENGYLAKNYDEFVKSIKRFMAGEVSFSAESLAVSAREEFGAKSYIARFESLAKSLTRK